MKDPVLSVEELPIVVESNVTVIGDEPEKPDPLIVNEDPEVPIAGLMVVEARMV